MEPLRKLALRHRMQLVGLAVLGLALVASGRPGPRFSRTEVERNFEGTAAFSPDGRTMFTSDERRARLLDLRTGAVRELNSSGQSGRCSRIYSPWFLDGGRYVGSMLVEPRPPSPGRGVYSIRVWETATGRAVVDTPELGNLYPDVKVSEDGSTLAYMMRLTNDQDYKPRPVCVWKAAWGPEVRTFSGSYSIALSGDGQFLATRSSGPWDPKASILVYDVEAKKTAATLALGPYTHPGVGPIEEYLALSHDGKILAENRSTGMILWDVVTSTQRADLGRESVSWPIRFAAGGSLLVLGELPGGRRYPWKFVTGEAWDLVASPPRRICQGEIFHVFADGHVLGSFDGEPAELAGPGCPAKLDQLYRSPGFWRNGVEVSAFAFGESFGLVAGLQEWTEPSPLEPIYRWLPGFVRAILPSREVRRIGVHDFRTGQTLTEIDLPPNMAALTACRLVAGGTALAVRYRTMDSPAGTNSRVVVQVWDLSARPRWRLVWASLVIVVAGIGLDLRARRRPRLAANPT